MRAIRTAVLIKTILSLLMTGSVPVGMFWLAWLLLGYLAGGIHHVLADLGGFFTYMFWVTVITLILAVPFSFAHLLLLGVPALVLGWRFRAIHWASVLLISFLIGAIPTGVLAIIAVAEDHVDPLSVPLAADVVGLGLVLGLATLMGLVGVIAGAVFWFLWRYWIFSDSPAERPLSFLEARNNISATDASSVPKDGLPLRFAPGTCRPPPPKSCRARWRNCTV